MFGNYDRLHSVDRSRESDTESLPITSVLNAVDINGNKHPDNNPHTKNAIVDDGIKARAGAPGATDEDPHILILVKNAENACPENLVEIVIVHVNPSRDDENRDTTSVSIYNVNFEKPTVEILGTDVATVGY